MQMRQIRWFRLRIAGLVVTCALMCVGCTILVGYLLQNVFGIETSHVAALTQENQLLQQKVASLTAQMKEMDHSISTLSDQGNQLRLLVDLPRMNEEVTLAGTGGALREPELKLNSDRTEEILQSASSTLLKLSSEVKVQQQSYEEILKRYQYNQKYFHSLPALKPMEGYYSLNGFGLRMHPVLGIFKTHEGLDIINDVGTPVYAAGDGRIEMSGQSGGGYGIVVVLNHGYGYQTFYAHLSKVLVREGEQVRRGEQIGLSGKTGLVSGPHLHFEVRLNGVCKNPVDYFFDDLSARQYRIDLASP